MTYVCCWGLTFLVPSSLHTDSFYLSLSSDPTMKNKPDHALRNEFSRNFRMENLEARQLLAADLSLGGAEFAGQTDQVEYRTTTEVAVEISHDGGSDLPAFSDDAALYQIFSNYGRTATVDLVNQSFDIANQNAGTKVNAAGFRAADNYGYGIISGNKELARIGSNGAIESLGSINGLPDQGSYYVGDFADDDLLYVRGSTDTSTLYGINVDSATVENVIDLSMPLNSIYDLAYNHVDQTFYASVRGSENRLVAADLAGNVTTIGNNGIGKLTFGAMYASADGNVYGASNSTGEIFHFDTATGEATLVGHAEKSGVNDGFSNATEVVQMPPLANKDSFEATTHDGLSGNVFADNGNGSDIDGNMEAFTVTKVNGNANNISQTILLETGSELTIHADGTFKYVASDDFADLTDDQTIVETFNYTIADAGGLESSSLVTIATTGNKCAEDANFDSVRVTGLDSFGGATHKYLVNAGDVNGDGYLDGMVSTVVANGASGVTAVIFGSQDGFKANFNINDLRAFNGGDGSMGALFYGIDSNDLSGYSLAALGDINGDNISDFAIGAKDADPNGVRNAGEAYVIFGDTNGFGAEVSLDSLLVENGGDGSKGFVLEGINPHDLAGGNIAGVGDINDDGFNDVAIAAKFADVDAQRKNAGQTFVVYGGEEFDAQLSLNDLTSNGGNDGSKGFVINGIRKHDLLGSDISGRRDFDGDGIDDMVLTARLADAQGLVDSGQSYLIYGREGGFGAEVELANMLESNGADGSEGIVINGSSRYSREGSFVKMVCDTNGDGLPELSIGDRDPNSVVNYLVTSDSVHLLNPEFEVAALNKNTEVVLDNFDYADADHDERDWDRYPHSVTLHSDVGTKVTIWGDPHVIVTIDGVTQRFDIGLGFNRVELVGGAVITWDTVEADYDRFPKGPPLEWFKVDTEGTDLDREVDLLDGNNFSDAMTGLTDGQLREFGRKLYAMRV